jgi:hypothetical protein
MEIITERKFDEDFRLKYKDINKSNKRQTYTHYMGVLGEKCSLKWANFTLKQGEN